MPRSRRRHHSRSRTRSRSRSHSCDKDRDTKRRKIENYDSPQHKRSDSPEDGPRPDVMETAKDQNQSIDSAEQNSPQQESDNRSDVEISSTASVGTPTVRISKTPKKPLTPKQLQKEVEKTEKLKERERLKEEKMKVLQEKKKLKQEENDKRIKEKLEKREQKQKEIEERQKNRDLKEEKRKKGREERDLKRKEREEKEEQKRREQDEKNKEKQKIEGKKQKAATAFVSFFTKKNDPPQSEERKLEKISTSTFMPFEVKSDMRIAPICRVTLDANQKNYIVEMLSTQLEHTYLDELRSGRKPRKSSRTWPFTEANRQDNEVVIVEEVVPGESIEEQPKLPDKQKAKFLKFDGNRRPAYFGTWRKTSALIKPRRPFTIDTAHFDYDVDSDEEWEEEDSGESLRGSDDDKENESGNEYEEDNEFFVPHGHLSDDEMNDEEDTVSPEAHKAKLKLLKSEFEVEMRSKTEKIKPRVIGCIWYNKDGSNVDPVIDAFLKPLSIISNGQIAIKKRNKLTSIVPVRRSFLPGKELSVKFVPDFLKWIHGSTKNSKALVEDFLSSLEKQNVNVEVSKTSLVKQLKKLAAWTRCPEGGPVLKKYCWFVHKTVGEEYNVDLPIPN